MSHYDVLVEGAGPAGATAAYYLAMQGKKVALVDRAKFPREKACGGGLCVHIEEFDHIISNWDDFWNLNVYEVLFMVLISRL